MSHSISVTIQHVDLYIKNCDTLINELKKDKERKENIILNFSLMIEYLKWKN